jgi:hypothetical protein
MTSTNRRSLLAAAPAIAAMPAVALAAQPSDPVYELIVAHRRAVAELGAELGSEEDVIAEIRRRRWWLYHANQPSPPAGCTDDPRWIEYENAVAARWSAEERALRIFACHEPASIAGMVAAIDYVREMQERGGEDALGERFSHHDAEGKAVYVDLSDCFLVAIRNALAKLA